MQHRGQATAHAVRWRLGFPGSSAGLPAVVKRPLVSGGLRRWWVGWRTSFRLLSGRPRVYTSSYPGTCFRSLTDRFWRRMRKAWPDDRERRSERGLHPLARGGAGASSSTLTDVNCKHEVLQPSRCNLLLVTIRQTWRSVTAPLLHRTKLNAAGEAGDAAGSFLGEDVLHKSHAR